MPRPYPPEFRSRAVALVRAGRPAKQSAGDIDLGITRLRIRLGDEAIIGEQRILGYPREERLREAQRGRCSAGALPCSESGVSGPPHDPAAPGPVRPMPTGATACELQIQ